MPQITGAILCAVLSVGCFIVSMLQFKGKGFLFNNAYIWASRQERERMDKKPHYRQSAIVFGILAVIFLCMAVECMLLTGWLWMVEGALTLAVTVYAVASSIKEMKA